MEYFHQFCNKFSPPWKLFRVIVSRFLLFILQSIMAIITLVQLRFKLTHVVLRRQIICDARIPPRRKKSGYLIIIFELNVRGALGAIFLLCNFSQRGCNIVLHFSINADDGTENFFWPITNLPDNRRQSALSRFVRNSPYYYYVNALIIIKFFANHPSTLACHIAYYIGGGSGAVVEL